MPKKPHETADATTFHGFQEQWLLDNVDIDKAMAVPGVAELLMEHYNNEVIEAFDEENEEP